MKPIKWAFIQPNVNDLFLFAINDNFVRFQIENC